MSETITDNYGRTITVVGSGPYTLTSNDGLVIECNDLISGINTFNNMMPEQYALNLQQEQPQQ